MRRGPKKSARVVAIARGHRKDSINHDEPVLPSAMGDDGKPPPPPANLNPEATAEWTRVAGTLTDRGVLTIGDLSMLEVYCLAWSRFKAAAATVRRAAEQYAKERAVHTARRALAEAAAAQDREPTPDEQADADRTMPTAAEIGAAEAAGFGLLYRNTHNNLSVNPIIQVLNAAEKNVVQAAAELGLTPASRARLKAERPPEAANPWGEFRQG